MSTVNALRKLSSDTANVKIKLDDLRTEMWEIVEAIKKQAESERVTNR